MSVIRSERTAAGLLLGAAALGLVLANSPAGPGLMLLQHASLGWPGTTMSVGHWISDGLLAIFFFLVAVELKHELAVGDLSSVHSAIHPAIAAVGGVMVPAGLYLLMAGPSGFGGGWPIPTATDIAFALGVLAVFGRGLPPRLRIFLLALAVLDDLIAIVIIAMFFTADPKLGELAAAAVVVGAFGVLSRQLSGGGRGRGMRVPIVILMTLLACLAWWLVHDSGVHATIAGVALGLVMSRSPARRTAHSLEPWSNGLILPLFAFSAALVALPAVSSPTQLAPPFWAILVALPVGKLVGITLGGWLGGFAVRGAGGSSRVGSDHIGDSPDVSASNREGGRSRGRIDIAGLATLASLGGIGFTVSLLMNDLAFSQNSAVRDEGTLAVLLGSAVSMIVAGVLVSRLAARYRRAHPPGAE